MVSREIMDIVDARGPLESAIREAIVPLVRDWEKEHGARVSGMDINMLEVGMGRDRWFEFGYVNVDVLMPDGTMIDRHGIRQHLDVQH